MWVYVLELGLLQGDALGVSLLHGLGHGGAHLGRTRRHGLLRHLHLDRHLSFTKRRDQIRHMYCKAQGEKDGEKWPTWVPVKVTFTLPSMAEPTTKVPCTV